MSSLLKLLKHGKNYYEIHGELEKKKETGILLQNLMGKNTHTAQEEKP